MTDQDLVSLGKLGRAHGVHGEIRLFAHNPDSELLTEGAEVAIRTPAGVEFFNIEKIRWGDRFGILQLEGVDDRDEAEALTNLDLYVDASQLPELDGEIYQRDLVGLPVVLGDGKREIGEVAGFFETGANDVMVVERPDGDTFYVPMAEVAVADIDLDDRRVVLQPLDEWAPEDFTLD